MYIPRDPPLVLHMPTSWQPAVQTVTTPNASAEVGLGGFEWAITQTEGECATIVPAT